MSQPDGTIRIRRTVGALLGKAQRYVADVKAEVNRSIELEELQKMKSQFETAARDVEQSVRQEVDTASQTRPSRTTRRPALERSIRPRKAGGNKGIRPLVKASPFQKWEVGRP